MEVKIKCFWVSNPEDGDREPYAIADIGESRARFCITPEGGIYGFNSDDELEPEDIYEYFPPANLIKLVEETPDNMAEE